MKVIEKKSLMKISELVEKADTPRTTIHYYLREGLLPPPLKTSRTIAYYGPEHVQRLREIRAMRRDELLPISGIKKAFSAPQGRRKSAPSRGGRVLTRQLIIEAALEQFSSRGYRKARVTDIISYAGISNMTFYRYFSGKRDLFLAVVEQVVDELVTRTEKGLAGEEDLVKRMMVRANVFFDVYSQNREIIHILWGESVGEEDELGGLARRIYSRFTDAIARDIEAYQAKGELPVFDTEIAAYSALGVAELLTLRINMDDRYDRGDYLRYVASALLGFRLAADMDIESLYAPYADFISEICAGKEDDSETPTPFS